MRIFILQLALLFINAYHLFSQTIFPLEIGNKWYYEITYQFYDPPRPASYYTVEVVGDTIMSNNKSYFILKPADILQHQYIRSDSQYVYYWTDCDNYEGCEVRVFNLKADVGIDDTINWHWYILSTLQQVYQETLFNQTTNFYHYLLGGLVFSLVTLSDKYGYTDYYYLGDNQYERDIWQLKGCYISDTLYGEMTDIRNENDIPENFFIEQNFPNPFNPTTRIEYRLTRREFVTLNVFDILGNKIITLVEEEKSAGEYEIEFRTTNIGMELSSGIYFYQIKAGPFIQTKKMILLR